jgi:hypothetical protein
LDQDQRDELLRLKNELDKLQGTLTAALGHVEALLANGDDDEEDEDNGDEKVAPEVPIAPATETPTEPPPAA